MHPFRTEAIPDRNLDRPTESVELTVRGRRRTPQLFEEDFAKICLIGTGHFSKVYLVRNITTRRFFAMKEMDKVKLLSESKAKNVMTERRLLSALDHPFVVSLRYAFQTHKKLFLVMDFVNGGELYQHLVTGGLMTETRVRQYAAEIFLALDYLHSRQIIYRDLKLENILLGADGHIVLVDFNYSRECESDERVLSFCGTVDYIAPEVLLGYHQESDGYGHAIDFWSLGIVIYELLCGLPPFYGDSLRTTYSNILYRQLRFPRQANVRLSSNCIDFIQRLLTRDPQNRINASEIRSHPWFGLFDWNDVYNRQLEPEFVPELTGAADTRYIDSSFLSQEDCWELQQGDSTSLHQRQTQSLRADLRREMLTQFEGFSFIAEEDDNDEVFDSHSSHGSDLASDASFCMDSIDSTTHMGSLGPENEVIVLNESKRVVLASLRPFILAQARRRRGVSDENESNKRQERNSGDGDEDEDGMWARVDSEAGIVSRDECLDDLNDLQSFLSS